MPAILHIQEEEDRKVGPELKAPVPRYTREVKDVGLDKAKLPSFKPVLVRGFENISDDLG